VGFGVRCWEIDLKAEMGECKEIRYIFTDAADIVLDQYADKCPMHYRDITDKIMDLDLVETEGKTPDATLYS
jgi:restriction system protein